MAQKKEYGLIFEDLSVKIVEVVVNKNHLKGNFLQPLMNEFEEELHRFLNKYDYSPIAIIPDTALYLGNYANTFMRDATNLEKREYLQIYEDYYSET